MTVATETRGAVVPPVISHPFNLELTISRPLGLDLGKLAPLPPRLGDPRLGDLRLIFEDPESVAVDIQKPGHIIFDIQRPGSVVIGLPVTGGPIGAAVQPIADIQKPGHILVDIQKPGHVDLGSGRPEFVAVLVTRPLQVDVILLDD